jgi:hypothetical protein
MTLFVSSTLRGFSGLLHCVRNDGQRWFASIYDEAFCYVLIMRHFACSLGTKRLFAMTDTDHFEAPYTFQSFLKLKSSPEGEGFALRCIN